MLLLILISQEASLVPTEPALLHSRVLPGCVISDPSSSSLAGRPSSVLVPEPGVLSPCVILTFVPPVLFGLVPPTLEAWGGKKEGATFADASRLPRTSKDSSRYRNVKFYSASYPRGTVSIFVLFCFCWGWIFETSKFTFLLLCFSVATTTKLKPIPGSLLGATPWNRCNLSPTSAASPF